MVLRFFHIGFALALSLTALAVRPCSCCDMQAEMEQPAPTACHACPEETPSVPEKGHDCDSGSGCCTISARHEAVSPPHHAFGDTPSLDKVPAIDAVAGAPETSVTFAAAPPLADPSRTTLHLICVYRC